MKDQYVLDHCGTTMKERVFVLLSVVLSMSVSVAGLYGLFRIAGG